MNAPRPAFRDHVPPAKALRQRALFHLRSAVRELQAARYALLQAGEHDLATGPQDAIAAFRGAIATLERR